VQIIPKTKNKFSTFAALFSKTKGFSMVISMINRLIFSFLFSVLFSFIACASETTSVERMASDTVSKATEPTSGVDEAHSKSFDPVGMIMHHIADANEFHILGHTTLPLPVIIYNKDKKELFTCMSSAFHAHHGEGTVEVNGYKMEHSRVHPTDGSHFIDFSITKNVFTMLMALTLLFIAFFSVRKAYATRENQAPSGFQSIMEPLIQFIAHDVARENIGKNYMKFTPFLVCVFFFILINNLIGLIPIFPGSANVSGNISFTLVLGTISFILINVFAKRDYWIHTFAMPGVPKALLLILTPIEILGLFIKPASLILRLFGNITGGHIAVMSIASVVFILGNVGKSVGGSMLGGAVAVPLLIFVNAMELFVAFLQAYVFTLLSSIFIGIAQEEHTHH
jgi:F-type H+-transporting ATPase subunit a